MNQPRYGELLTLREALEWLETADPKAKVLAYLQVLERGTSTCCEIDREYLRHRLSQEVDHDFSTRLTLVQAGAEPDYLRLES